MSIKEELYQNCEAYLNSRYKVVNTTIADIQKSLQSETKSSAGDKHETGRAMLQIEREKAGNQLAQLQKLKETLHKINPEAQHDNVKLGSVILTSGLNYFVSISAGEIIFRGTSYYAISALTPIAKLLLGTKPGDEVCFRSQKFRIISVL